MVDVALNQTKQTKTHESEMFDPVEENSVAMS